MRTAHNLNGDVMNERQNQILAFCVGGKTSFEIAEHVGLAQPSIYGELRLLQRLGLIEKRGDDRRRAQPATFITIGTQPQLDARYESEYDPALINVDFIRTGHNIFARTAQ